jgi:Kef-type K+ transport system membrane component KefB
MAIIKIDNGEVMRSLGQIGITLLLFMLGMEIRLSKIQSVGKVALITGLGQILFTTAVGFVICVALGFSPLASLYMAIALTFSSTIIIVKLLSDKKDLNSLYGKIAVGVLLVQDFVAIIALIFLSGFQNGGQPISVLSFGLLMLKAVVLFGWVILFSNTLLPKIVNKIAGSSEVLFLFSIAWAFSLAALVSSPYVGLSIEIGGFLAGFALGNSSENFQIVAKVKAVRDFFITIFFVTLGMSLVFDNISRIWLPASILAVYVLIGNPIILMGILGFLGYRKRTSFLVGLTVSQISEFSMIVVFMGYKLNHVQSDVVSVITVAGTITFVLSTYMIMNGNSLYKKLSPFLDIFERKHTHEQTMKIENLTDHVILVGANRMGETILEALLKMEHKVIVVDFDPEVIERLREKKVNCLYGDIADFEIQEKINISCARLIISTVPDVEDNLLLLESISKQNKKALVVVCALEKGNAAILYKAGADYVVLPHLAGGRHLAKILVDKNHLEIIEEYKAKDRSVFLHD